MFIVEGNIGAGKSTFLSMIKETRPELSVCLEPINTWQKNVSGGSLLQQFYQDPKRWAYSFETYAMTCRVVEHLKEQVSGTLKIMERSIYSGHYCFAKNGYLNGFMSEMEWTLYNRWFDFLIPGKCAKPLGFIYLKTEPHIAYERIARRARGDEKGISFEYIQQIGKCHDDFLVAKKDIHPELSSVPVLILDCNEEFQRNHKEFARHLEKIEEFMHTAVLSTRL